MSRPSRTLSLLVAASILVALPFTAAPANAAEDDPPAFMQHLFAPELILENARAIGLDKEQRKAVIETIQQTQAQTAEVQWSVFEAAETLSELAAADPIDEEAMLATAREIFEAEGRIKEAHLSLLIRLRNQLTQNQRTKLAEIRSEAN